MKRFEEMTIIDSFSENEQICEVDMNKLRKYVNPNYWENELNKFSFQTRMRNRRMFNDLLSKYELSKIKDELREAFNAKFEFLIDN